MFTNLKKNCREDGNRSSQSELIQNSFQGPLDQYPYPMMTSLWLIPYLPMEVNWEPQLGSRRFGQVASGATLDEEDHGNHGTGQNMVQKNPRIGWWNENL